MNCETKSGIQNRGWLVAWWLYRSLRLAGCVVVVQKLSDQSGCMVVVQKLEASRLRGGCTEA